VTGKRGFTGNKGWIYPETCEKAIPVKTEGWSHDTNSHSEDEKMQDAWEESGREGRTTLTTSGKAGAKCRKTGAPRKISEECGKTKNQ